jgi:anti-sigma-K factor RskA
MTAHVWRDHAAPYALGALDENERAEFENHIASCEECRGEVREMSEVAGLLAYATESATPPASLRDRILADARQVRPMSSRVTPPAAIPQEPSGAKAPPVARRPVAGRGSLPWLAAAAAVLVAAALGVRYQAERESRTVAERALAEAVRQLKSKDSLLAASDSTITALLAPDVETVVLATTGRPPSARIYWNRKQNVMILAAFALPRAAQGRTYQLWGIETVGGKSKAPVSLGTFNTDSSGRAQTSLRVPPGMRFGVAAVTEEPAGGSPQPTTTPFLVATWKSTD